MREIFQDAQAEVAEIFTIGFADFAQQEAFESGDTLAIVSAHLGDEPVRFATAAGAAVTDSGGAVREVTQAGGRAGGQLPGVEDEAGLKEIFDLVARATGGGGIGQEVIERHGVVRTWERGSVETAAGERRQRGRTVEG